jgi:heme A synthase
MEPIVQALIVAILVAASAVVAAWRLMPARTKLRVLDGVNPSNGNAVGRWLLRIRKNVLAQITLGACSACSQASNHVQKHAAPKRP